MADNTTFSAGTADGDTYASDDIGGIKFARTKIVIGADGTNDGDVASGNPLPVSGTVDLGATDNAVLDAIAASLAGTITVGSHAVTNAGTFAVQVDGAALTALQLIDDAIYADDAVWTNNTSKHFLSGGLYQSTRQTITDGSVAPIQLTSDGRVMVANTDGAGNDLEYAKEGDNWNAADHGIILFARDTDSTPDKYRAVQVDANGHLKIGDGGDTITVDGTVTANLSATDNTVLDSIATNTTGLNSCVGGSELQVDVVGALPAGTNAIGKLAANSGVDIGDVDVTSIAAGTNTIGGTIAQLSSSTAYDGTTACTIKRKSGVVAAAATTAILAAVTDKKFRILAFQLLATSATANTFYLATTTDTDVLGSSSATIPIAMDADGDNAAGFSMAWNPGGWTETSTATEALNLVTSSAAPVVYCITYIEVD